MLQLTLTFEAHFPLPTWRSICYSRRKLSRHITSFFAAVLALRLLRHSSPCSPGGSKCLWIWEGSRHGAFLTGKHDTGKPLVWADSWVSWVTNTALQWIAETWGGVWACKEMTTDEPYIYLSILLLMAQSPSPMFTGCQAAQDREGLFYPAQMVLTKVSKQSACWIKNQNNCNSGIKERSGWQLGSL